MGGSECTGRPVFIFLLKKIEFGLRPDIMPSQTVIYYWQGIFLLILVSDSEAIVFMIPLHCLWAKSNNRTPDQFECDMTWFYFCFDFVRSHARCAFCSIVCWREWGVCLKLDVQGQGGGTILDVDGQETWGFLKIRQFSWTSYVYRPISWFVLTICLQS